MYQRPSPPRHRHRSAPLTTQEGGPVPRFPHGGAVFIVPMTGQQLAGERVLVVMAEQTASGEKTRGKVSAAQPLLPVTHAEAFVLCCRHGEIARSQTHLARLKYVEEVVAGHGGGIRLQGEIRTLDPATE